MRMVNDINEIRIYTMHICKMLGKRRNINQFGRVRILIGEIAIILLLSVISVGAQGVKSYSENEEFSVYQQQPPVYAVVIKQSTYDNVDWQAVVKSLLSRYQGQLFIWDNFLDEVQSAVAAYHPTHIGFVCELSTATPDFVQSSVWPFTRTLDSDEYCDAIWGIITGFDAEIALELVTGSSGFKVKTVLGGTASCDLNYYTQGIGTSEATYGLYYVKYPDSLATTTFTDGPTDRTEWLVDMINSGINIFDFDPVDIFYTSGHGNYNVWQMHYPTSGLEGFFRSSVGQVYGDPASGSNININSKNPKIYFGLGNCYIGQIYNNSCMAPSWIQTGGAYQYTGYVIAEGTYSHQHGGTKAYFYRVARNFTWAESFFLANIALRFDMINGTPGANPPDLNGSALYGDPGINVRMSNDGVFKQPLFSSELTVNEGTEKDTITFKITMNREGNPGYTSKWGERHPATILPFHVENVEILDTDALTVVIEDNFALMYTWYKELPSLAEGETREVTFTCNHVATGIDKNPVPGTNITGYNLSQNYPNPFNPTTTIMYQLADARQVKLIVYNTLGQNIQTLVNNWQPAGNYKVEFSGEDLPSGIYFYELIFSPGTKLIRKMILLR